MNPQLRVLAYDRQRQVACPKTISAGEGGKIEAIRDDTRGQSASFRFLAMVRSFFG